MTDSDTYRTVFGVDFYQPEDEFGLNETSIVDNLANIFYLLLSPIPLVGIGLTLSLLSYGYIMREINEFRIPEQSWKTGVYCAVLHLTSMLILVVANLI